MLKFVEYSKNGKVLVDESRFKRNMAERKEFCRWANDKLKESELGKAVLRSFGEVE